MSLRSNFFEGRTQHLVVVAQVTIEKRLYIGRGQFIFEQSNTNMA